MYEAASLSRMFCCNLLERTLDFGTQNLVGMVSSLLDVCSQFLSLYMTKIKVRSPEIKIVEPKCLSSPIPEYGIKTNVAKA